MNGHIYWSIHQVRISTYKPCVCEKYCFKTYKSPCVGVCKCADVRLCGTTFCVKGVSATIAWRRREDGMIRSMRRAIHCSQRKIELFVFNSLCVFICVIYSNILCLTLTKYIHIDIDKNRETQTSDWPHVQMQIGNWTLGSKRINMLTFFILFHILCYVLSVCMRVPADMNKSYCDCWATVFF